MDYLATVLSLSKPPVVLARGSRMRLDSEVIRDQILAISGRLNNARYGRSVKPPQPADLWKTVSMVSSPTYFLKEDTGDKIYRRSFYTFWVRWSASRMMSMSVRFYPKHEFACPNLSHCPHLGGMALGTLVVIANRCDQSFESSRLTIRGLEERNAELLS